MNAKKKMKENKNEGKQKWGSKIDYTLHIYFKVFKCVCRSFAGDWRNMQGVVSGSAWVVWGLTASTHLKDKLRKFAKIVKQPS